MKATLLTLLAVLTITLGARHALANHSLYIQNASFEAPANNPDFTYCTITGWVSKHDKSGVARGGYADNGQRPDKRQVIFVETPSNQTANIRQWVYNVDTNKQYCLQFWHNCYSAITPPYTNACIFDVALVHSGIQQFIGRPFNGYTNTPVGGTNPYCFESIVFTPGSNSVELRFRNVTWSNGRASVLLLDGITVFELDNTNDVLIKNPSFEASGEQGPGGAGDGFINKDAAWNPLADVMAGWNYWDNGVTNAGFGVGAAANPYLAPAPVPEGLSAFFLDTSKGTHATRTTLAQTIDGFAIGRPYALSYEYHARAGYNPSNFTVMIGGIEVQREEFLPTAAAFSATSVTFVANAASMALVFGTSNAVNASSLALDNVRIWPLPQRIAITNTPVAVSSDRIAGIVAGTSSNIVGSMWVTNATAGGAAIAFAPAAAWTAPAINLATGDNVIVVGGVTAEGAGVSDRTTIYRRPSRSVFLTNPSFESPTNTPDWFYDFSSSNWYEGAITGWQKDHPVWVNVQKGGYANAGPRPDRAQVAALVTYAGASESSIRQTINNLDTTKQYCLQFWYNAYNNNNEPTQTNVCDFAVTLSHAGGEQWLFFTNNVADTNAYYFQSTVFTPAANTVELCFRNWKLEQVSALLLDGICLYELTYPDEVLVKNPSFEASGEGTGYWGGEMPGLDNGVAGWACTVHGFGTSDGLLAPDIEGRNVYHDFEMTGAGDAYPAGTLVQQTVGGFTPAQDYYVGFTYGSSFASPSNFAVTVAGTQVFSSAAFAPGIYRQLASFTASGPTMDLVFSTATTSENKDLVLDDIMIWPVPEPVLLLPLLLLCSLKLKG